MLLVLAAPCGCTQGAAAAVCRGAVHVQLLGALNLETPLAPLTPPQIRFGPDFPSQNSLLFRGAHLLRIFRGNQSDSGSVSSNCRACQASC